MVLNKLSQDKKDKLRLLAAELMDEWRDVDAVAQILGCRRDFIKRWHRHYQKGGRAALTSPKKAGRPSKLNGIQKSVIKEMLFGRTPLELGFDQTLWTNRLLVDLIAKLYRIDLGLPSANCLLESFGIRNGNPHSVQARRAQLLRIQDTGKENAKMMSYFQYAIAVEKADAGGCRPLPVDNRRDHRRLQPNWVLGAADTRNSRCFMVSLHEPDADLFVVFLERLIHQIPAPINLVVDTELYPPSPAIEAFVNSAGDRLQLIRSNGHLPHGGQRTGKERRR